MSTPQEKGNALEEAVFAIEAQILRASPHVKEKSYLIERKKLIKAAGVPHEIDLFVTFELGSGYVAVFIFECKNWKDPVGKDEIIVFKEKIAAAGAQRGFFIAKSFTGGAEAQAKLEPRMELIVASEHDPISTVLPFGYHSTFTRPKSVNFNLRKWGALGLKAERYVISQAVAVLEGNPLNLLDYANTWMTEAINESVKTFPSGTLGNGTYERECQATRTFAEGAFVVNDSVIENARISVKFEIDLFWPAIKSHFDVNGRGRVISFEAHTVGSVTVNELHFIFGPEQPS